MLIPNYVVRAEISRLGMLNDPNEAALDRQLAQYNNKFSQLPRNLSEQVRDGVVLLRDASEVHPVYRTIVIAILVIMLVYIILPVDFVSDSIGLLGYADDLFVVVLLLIFLLMVAEHRRQALIDRLNRENN